MTSDIHRGSGSAPVTASAAATGGATGGPASYLKRLLHVQETGIVVVLILIVALVALGHPRFVSSQSLTNLTQQSAFFGIMALGVVFLLAMRELDLSVGSNYSVCTIATAVLARDGLNPWVAAVAGILLGAALGAVNALLANRFKLPVIIISLGTLSAYRGLTQVVSHSSPIGGQPVDSSFYRWVGATHLGLPTVVYVFFVLCGVLTFVFRSTRFGYAVRAVGSNEEAARLTGYPIARVRLTVLTLVGALCGLSGVCTLAYFGAADPGVGTGYELTVIAAAIIGGTGLAGGAGSVPGALIGALLISVIAGALTQVGVPADWGQFVTGVVIVTAVGFDALVRRRTRAGVRA